MVTTKRKQSLLEAGKIKPREKVIRRKKKSKEVGDRKRAKGGKCLWTVERGRPSIITTRINGKITIVSSY